MKLKEHLEKFDESMEESLGESPKPFAVDDVVSEVPDLFASVENLECVIRDKDKIIESLKNESVELRNQIYKVEEEKSTILEELEEKLEIKYDDRTEKEKIKDWKREMNERKLMLDDKK